MPDSDPPELVSGLDLQPLLAIIAAGEVEDRITLARSMGKLIADQSATAEEAHLLLAMALGLAADPDPAVRHALAVALASLADLDSDLLFAIVSDSDPIALPFLCATPSLSPWHMLAVLRVGDVARQACVALRPDLDPAVAEVIVQELTWPVNQLLLENHAMPLSQEQFWTLYDRFGGAPEALDALLARPDLPAPVRIAAARRASARLRIMLAERRWLPARAAAELLAEAEENAILAILATADSRELGDAVAFLEQSGALTPAIVLRAACRGAWPVVEAVLQRLTGKPAAEFDFAPRRVRSLIARAGLPDVCLWTLRAAYDTDAAERQDVFRLTEDEFGAVMIERLEEGYKGMTGFELTQSLDLIARFGAPGAARAAKSLLIEKSLAA